MKFNVSIPVNGKPINLSVERIKLTQQIQQFRISGKDKSIVIQNDQPLLNKVNMYNRKAPWKLIEGNIKNAEVFIDVLRIVDQRIRLIGKTTVTNGRVNNWDEK